MNKSYVGDGKVVLIAGGGKIYTDVAARFVRSERGLDDIIASPYSKQVVQNILEAGHKAALEFDNFIFGVEGYARVTEVQLVRKRHASYMIKTGRANKDGKRSFDVVVPKSIESHIVSVPIDCRVLDCEDQNVIDTIDNRRMELFLNVDSDLLLRLAEAWYDSGVEKGYPEEDLRYMKPQATEFKAIVSMNAHGLLDWFQIRCCKNAQAEIRDMAMKMMRLAKEAAPDLFVNAGPSCVALGYCPENKFQHPDCRGKIITKNEAMEILKQWKKDQRDT